jgi:hypothetical protein
MRADGAGFGIGRWAEVGACPGSDVDVAGSTDFLGESSLL